MCVALHRPIVEKVGAATKEAWAGTSGAYLTVCSYVMFNVLREVDVWTRRPQCVSQLAPPIKDEGRRVKQPLRVATRD